MTSDRQKTRLCHINLLKPYYACDTFPVVFITSQVAVEDEESEDDEAEAAGLVTVRLKNSSAAGQSQRLTESSYHGANGGCGASSGQVW